MDNRKKKKKKRSKDDGSTNSDEQHTRPDPADEFYKDGDSTVLFDNQQYITAGELENDIPRRVPRNEIHSFMGTNLVENSEYASFDGGMDHKQVTGPVKQGQDDTDIVIVENDNYAAYDSSGTDLIREDVTSNRRTAPEPEVNRRDVNGRNRIRTMYGYEDIGLESIHPPPVANNNIVSADNDDFDIEPDYDTAETNEQIYVNSVGDTGHSDVQPDVTNHYQLAQAIKPNAKPATKPKPKITSKKHTSATNHVQGPLGDVYALVSKTDEHVQDIDMKDLTDPHQKQELFNRQERIEGPLGDAYTMVNKNDPRKQSVFDVV